MALNSDAEKKVRLSVYLEPGLAHSIAGYAARRGQSRSLIAEAAIASFLSPDTEERHEAAVAKRIDNIDRRIQRLERDLGISVEMMAVFVRFWLASTPQLSDAVQTATRAKAGERYDNFLDVLGRRLASGPRIRQEIAEDTDRT